MQFHPTGGPARRTGAPAVPDAVAVRSILAASCSLRARAGDTATDLIDSHVVLPDGTVVLAVDAMTAFGGRLVAARGRRGGVRLDVTQPVPVRSRVRARITCHGTVRPFDPARLDGCDADTVLSLLDLPAVALWSVEPVDVRIERDGTTAAVAVAAYRAARPDPVAAVEAAHLQHLARHPAERIAGLAGPMSAGAASAAPTRFVAVAIDAGGLTLRAEARHRHHDIRLPFSRRVTTADALLGELQALLARGARGALSRPARDPR